MRKTYELEFNKLIRQRKKSLEIFDIQLHETYLYTRNKNKNVVEFLRRNSRGNENWICENKEKTNEMFQDLK